MSDRHHEFLTAAQKRFARQAAKDPINIEALAVKIGLDWLYDMVYRMSSSDAAHVSLDAFELCEYAPSSCAKAAPLSATFRVTRGIRCRF